MAEMKGTRGRKPRVHIITMGCAKNTVDSEKLMAQLRLNRIPLADDIADADIAVINTCGFIDAAKQESVDMIVATARQQRKGASAPGLCDGVPCRTLSDRSREGNSGG